MNAINSSDPSHAQVLKERDEAQADAKKLADQNVQLTQTVREARDQIVALKEEMDRLAQPPAGFGVYLSTYEDGTVDVFTGGRELRVAVSPDVDAGALQVGQKVMLNEALNVVRAMEFERIGEIVALESLLDDERALVVGHTDEMRVVRIAEPLRGTVMKSGDSLMLEPRSGIVYERIPKVEVDGLLLEKVPDIDYSDIGGMLTPIGQIRGAIESPYLYQLLYADYKLQPPKGVLLFGPPGCGKTLIAKAVASQLAQAIKRKTGSESTAWFIRINGPELLNKYVGETERHIRLVFQRAREKANDNTPVIIFFDEMDALFPIRGSGISSDVQNTIVPQLLSEMDGVESLRNVIVIGASNRQDMIDPAILRPGRLDRKIKIERPDAESGSDIYSKYLTADLPLHPDDLAENGEDPVRTVNAMIVRAVEFMYSQVEATQFLEVTYSDGEKETLYFRDFSSGAMIKNIVDRAKEMAIKDEIEGLGRGLRVQHLLDACADEFRESQELPNTTNPDDWARISGKHDDKRIVSVRSLVAKKQTAGRQTDDVSNTGQYL